MNRAKELISRLSDIDENANLYAVADAAIYRELADLLEIYNPHHRILFKDAFVEAYGSVAPYLIELNEDDPFLQELVAEGFGKTWLSFLLSRCDIDTLANRLKEYINPYSQEHKQEVILRFYDPRNIERYFAMQSQEELATFFNEIEGKICSVDLKEPTILYLYDGATKRILSLKGDKI